MLGMDVVEDSRPKCACTVRSQCPMDTTCECVDYCKDHLVLYNKIMAATNYCWMTISPKSHQNEDEDAKYIEWMNDFADLKICSDAFIVVTEFTQKQQMHFHLLIKFKIGGKIKYQKQFVAKWYWLGNILPIYDSPPIKGIHYLFKTATYVSEYIDQPAVQTSETLPYFIKQSPSLRRQFTSDS